ncbi:hypothetical protein VTG60DRAFT_3482 [Thermothelomyces hinnuleus]
MDSLTGDMANLTDSKTVIDNVGKEVEATLLSASSCSSEKSLCVEESTGGESSQDETSAESDLSSDEETVLNTHLDLLHRRPELDELNEIKTTPCSRKQSVSTHFRCPPKRPKNLSVSMACWAATSPATSVVVPRLIPVSFGTLPRPPASSSVVARGLVKATLCHAFWRTPWRRARRMCCRAH